MRLSRTALEGVGMTLEQELIDIFAATPAERNREILIGYYGWEDGRQHTLTEIGARFGITRERVRQVCAKLTKRAKIPSAGAAPCLDRSLALVASRVPCPAVEIEAELRQQGLTAVGMSIEGVAAGARLLGRPVRFKIVKVPGAKGREDVEFVGKDHGRLVIRPDQFDSVLAMCRSGKEGSLLSRAGEGRRHRAGGCAPRRPARGRGIGAADVAVDRRLPLAG